MTVNRWIVIGMLLAGGAPLQARVVHVDGGGGGDAVTIQEGLDIAVDGDTVLVAPGTYNEGDLSFAGRGIYLKGEGGARVVRIDGRGTNTTIIFDLRHREGRDTVVDGFRVMAGGWNWRCFAISGSSPVIENCIIEGSTETGILINGGGAPLVRDNILIKHQKDAIYIWGYSSPTISGNLIYGNGGSGIYSSNSTPLIRDNVIVENGQAGINAAGNVTISSNIIAGNYQGIREARIVTNNLLIGNRMEGLVNGSWPSPIKRNNVIVGSETGISIGVVWPVVMENNVIVGCGTGIYATTGSQSDPHIVRNNVIADCDRGIYCFYPSILMDLTYNDLWNNRLGDYVNCTPGEGSVSLDPSFVDPGRNHYALSAASPLIDLGAPALVDPDSTRSDIGAYGGPDALALALSLIPRDTILTRGADSLLYDLILSNTTGLTQDVRVWAKLILASREPYPGNPVLGPLPLELGPHETISTPVPIVHSIPFDAPTGIYEYRVNVAEPPGEIRTRTRFYFDVRP